VALISWPVIFTIAFFTIAFFTIALATGFFFFTFVFAADFFAGALAFFVALAFFLTGFFSVVVLCVMMPVYAFERDASRLLSSPVSRARTFFFSAFSYGG
jgi:hypothetical protein